MQQGARLVILEHQNHAELLWVVCAHPELRHFCSNCHLVTKVVNPIYPCSQEALRIPDIVTVHVPSSSMPNRPAVFSLWFLKLKKDNKTHMSICWITVSFKYILFFRHNKHVNWPCVKIEAQLILPFLSDMFCYIENFLIHSLMFPQHILYLGIKQP